MVNKKGFIRTMEAVIAVLLVLSFLLYILPRRTAYAESTIPEGLESSRNYILNQFLYNQDVRNCLGELKITTQSDALGIAKSSSGFKCENTDCWSDIIKPLIDEHVVPGFNSSCEICDHVSPCTSLPMGTMKKSIYPGAVFMYFTNDNVKYVRIYFWRE